jgi:large subunit ribosomal protein L14e
MTLTKLVLKDVPRTAGTKCIRKIASAQDLTAKWAATEWAKKLATKAARANSSDFDRFKVMLAKKTVSLHVLLAMPMS